MEDYPKIEQRLERLERQNRRWRGLAVTSCCLLLGLVLMGQAPAPPDSTAAEQPRMAIVDGLIVRDTDGKPRIRMGVNDSGEAFLTMVDADNNPQLLLSALNAGAEIAVRGGGQANNVVRLAAGKDGTSGLSLADRRGVNRLVMVLKDQEEENQASIFVLDPDQQPLFVAPPR